MSRIFLVAGESSGDIHGANLIRAIHAQAPGIVCEGIGGYRMKEAGMILRMDLAEKAIMGFVEVIRSLSMLRRLFHDTVSYIRKTRPGVVVLIDYPGFNLRLAREVHQMGIPVVYYISPQIWAWKKKRIHAIARSVRKMLVILPFEEALYRRAGINCTYVGHPLLDHIEAVPVQGIYPKDSLIGLFPGSREQEIRRIFGVMLEIAREIHQQYPEWRFVVPCVDRKREMQVREMAGNFPLETTVGNAYEVLNSARFCLVTSGTATIETMLFNVPMVILYRMAPLTYWIARLLVKVEHIGLVNILAGKRIVPEFIQHQACAEQVLPVVLQLLENSPERDTMLRELAAVREKIGAAGASARAAKEILLILQESMARQS